LIGTDSSGYFTEPETARAGYREVLKTGQVRDCSLAVHGADQRTSLINRGSDVAHDTTGIAGHNDVRRDVMQNDAAGPDGAVVTDRHARADDDARADPDVLADDDRQRLLEAPLPFTRIDGVGGGAQLYSGAEHRACPYRDRSAVENDALDVDVCSGT